MLFLQRHAMESFAQTRSGSLKHRTPACLALDLTTADESLSEKGELARARTRPSFLARGCVLLLDDVDGEEVADRFAPVGSNVHYKMGSR